MLLRASSEKVELGAVLGSAASDDRSTGVAYGDRLVAFVEAMMTDGDPDREGLIAALGEAGFVDVCAVIANFQMMTRIADATGISLDDGLSLASQGVRDELGLETLGAGSNQAPTSVLERAAGRLVSRLTPVVLRVANRLGQRRPS
jgi:hypothetical protein